MKKKLLLLFALTTCAFSVFAQPIYNEAGIRLYHTPSQEELDWAKANGIKSVTIPTPPPVGELRPVAEFEPAEAVLIRYPLGIPYSLVKEMAKDIKVITVVSSGQLNNAQNNFASNGVNMANCEFLVSSSDSYWTRDYGPWFMAVNDSEVAMYDFNYNRPRPNDNQINSKLVPFLSSNGPNIERYASTLEHAGGNFMNDGTSQAASTDLVLQENPSYTQQQLKQHFLEYMGIEQYHFTADPLGEYIAHIDCWGKYLAPNKVLIGQVPTSNPRYHIYESVAEFFAQQISPWGMPFEVYRIYTPGATGWGPSTPYTNSLILNNKVFVPQTGNANDAAALQVYANAMPGYEIIGINSPSGSAGWEDTDALHCRTHEIADRCMLYIKHQPLFGEIANTGSVTFSAELYSYCDNTIYSDSVIVYVRANGGDYQPFNMEYSGDNVWETTATGLPTGQIEYYIFAADESGRRENHPYIGAPDPHKFILTGEFDGPVLSLDKTNSSVTIEESGIVEDFITVSNTGTQDLTFEIKEIDFDEMLTITPTEGTVPPGESLAIKFEYDYQIVAKNIEFSGSCKLLSNDPSHAETEITLYANILVGVTDIQKPAIHIYPNPTTGELRIENGEWRMENGEWRISNVEVFDIYGRLLSTFDFQLSTNKIDVSHLPAGLYFIKIDGYAYKFVKQ